MDATIDDGPEGGQYFLGIPSTHAALIIKKQIKGIIIVGINYPGKREEAINSIINMKKKNLNLHEQNLILVWIVGL